jgi:hypothetical protein
MTFFCQEVKRMLLPLLSVGAENNPFTFLAFRFFSPYSSSAQVFYTWPSPMCFLSNTQSDENKRGLPTLAEAAHQLKFAMAIAEDGARVKVLFKFH